MLQAEVGRRLGPFRLDVGIGVRSGSTLALVGESGSGKTTFLRLLAGLLRPERGRIVVDGEVYFDGPGGVDLPARERQIGYVAQDYALFPHLTVAQNVAFGLRASGHVQARARAAAMLEQLGMAPLARRRPAELSGGQQQRVALARALALEPRLLLLDEPLSALDLQTRRTVRGELRRLLSRLPCVTVYVTHSPTEAIFFGDEIAVLESGRVGQCGSPEELLRRPRSPYVAELMGVNLLRGEVGERLPGGLARVATADGHLLVPDPGGDGEIFLVVDPREIVLSLQPLEGSARNSLEGAIEEMNLEPPLGERVRVALATRPPLVAEVTRQSVESLGLRPGLSVHAAFKATGVIVFR